MNRIIVRFIVRLFVCFLFLTPALVNGAEFGWIDSSTCRILDLQSGDVVVIENADKACGILAQGERFQWSQASARCTVKQGDQVIRKKVDEYLCGDLPEFLSYRWKGWRCRMYALNKRGKWRAKYTVADWRCSETQDTNKVVWTSSGKCAYLKDNGRLGRSISSWRCGQLHESFEYVWRQQKCVVWHKQKQELLTTTTKGQCLNAGLIPKHLTDSYLGEYASDQNGQCNLWNVHHSLEKPKLISPVLTSNCDANQFRYASDKARKDSVRIPRASNRRQVNQSSRTVRRPTPTRNVIWNPRTNEPYIETSPGSGTFHRQDGTGTFTPPESGTGFVIDNEGNTVHCVGGYCTHE